MLPFTVPSCMAQPSLSVVMPVHNEAVHVPATVDALVAALARTSFDAELVVVDDGSSDGSGAAVKAAVDGRLPLRIIAQANRGRLEARRLGLEVATGEWALLLDGRVTVDPDSLAFVAERLGAGERIWTAHVHVAADSNPYGMFWGLLAELAWSEYFARPRTTSFGAESFDRFPKGTTCFLAPRALLLDAMAAFRSRYEDVRNANDDTPLLRWIAGQEPIHVSPHFSCIYMPREQLAPFVRHSFHRGIVFLDGHGRPESRFFPLVLAFYPASAGLALAALRRPILLPAAAATVAAAAGIFGSRQHRTPFEIASLVLLTPVYAVAHGAGMWRGLGLLLHDRLRGSARR